MPIFSIFSKTAVRGCITFKMCVESCLFVAKGLNNEAVWLFAYANYFYTGFGQFAYGSVCLPVSVCFPAAVNRNPWDQF